MFIRFLFVLSIVSILSIPNNLFADSEENPLSISGTIYFEWAYLTGYDSIGDDWGGSEPTIQPPNFGVANEDQNDTFRLTRVYLTLRKAFTESWSFRITTDISTSDSNDLFLKYAYIQYQANYFDSLGITFQLGKIGTPAIGLITSLSDFRWIYSDYLTKSQNLLSGALFDHSSDYGFSLKFSIFDIIHITGTMTNGEGFKKSGSEISDTTTSSDDKAMYGLISIVPFSHLWINFYYRYENYSADQGPGGTSYKYYYGSGIAWKSDFIKFGVNFFILQDNDKSNFYRSRSNYTLIDGWINLDFGALNESFPFLLVGRFGHGYKTGSDISGPYQRTYLWSVGAGWRFNRNFRILFYYEQYKYDLGNSGFDPEISRNCYIKTEIKF